MSEAIHVLWIDCCYADCDIGKEVVVCWQCWPMTILSMPWWMEGWTLILTKLKCLMIMLRIYSRFMLMENWIHRWFLIHSGIMTLVHDACRLSLNLVILLLSWENSQTGGMRKLHIHLVYLILLVNNSYLTNSKTFLSCYWRWLELTNELKTALHRQECVLLERV